MRQRGGARKWLPLATVMVLWGVLVPASASQDQGVVTRVTPLIGSAGNVIGEVVFRGSANATTARITVAPGGLTPGWHGVHFSANADCSDPDQFRRAKDIVDRLVKSHGLLNDSGPKEGDLPNIYVNPDGSANAEVSSLSVRMLGPTGLIEGSGSALVIRADEDDLISQPAGNAGARVACAVIK